MTDSQSDSAAPKNSAEAPAASQKATSCSSSTILGVRLWRAWKWSISVSRRTNPTLKQTEDELGGALFEGERKARLTRFGEFVLDHARGLVEHGDRVNRTIGAFAHNGMGNVKIAVLPSIALAFLPEALKSFAEKQANVAVHLRDLDTNAILDGVSREMLDWGVASYHPVPHLHAVALFSEPLSLVCTEDDPLCSHKGPIPWEAITDRPFIANGSYGSIATPAFREIAESTCIHVRSTLSLLSTVRAGVGRTVLPSLSRLGGSKGLRFLPVDDPTARRIVHILSRADRNLSPRRVSSHASCKASSPSAPRSTGWSSTTLRSERRFRVRRACFGSDRQQILFLQ